MSSNTPARLDDLSAIKIALMAKKARADSQRVLQADPIAIVGMGCRLPGGGDTPERFWQILSAGIDTIRDVPRERWDGSAWYDADPAAPARSLTRWGGFIDAIDGFDAEYFGILPREAERMDPQQRLLLEVAIEALDDAGLTRKRLRGSRTGVFIASYHNDYSHLQYNDLEAIDSRTLTGTLHSVLTNRLSYFLDLRGPSVSIDTACSSSLVATHLACQSLRSGESDIAVAGGVSLMVTPDLMIALSKVGFMAPDGRSKAFDARANGFGRGEGCGVVVLKRLADAIADGDRVLAVVRGSAVNQDGHSTLLAAPNGLAQQALLTEALANAQLTPSRIGFVETHGTGTALGDPIEVEAIATVVGRREAGAGPCYLGAAKANLGHLEAAAGVVGLIKTVLVLRHEEVPPQVHFTKLNPHISLENTRLAVPAALTPWPAGPAPRCAGVSSFGVGGTNAHVVIEEAPKLPAAKPAPDEELRILPLSAASPAALHSLAGTWVGFLRETPSSTADLCTTAAERRSHLDYRLAVVGRTKDELAVRLGEWLRAEPAPAGDRRASAPPRVAFVFGGQGSQWFAMGRELLASEPVFRSVIEECDQLLRPLSGWSLLAEFAASEADSRLDQTEVAQPMLFALQVGLVALWKSWGIAPDGVVGHSVGELAALHVAGVLSLPEAVRVVWHRGRIMQQATGRGRMASVALTLAEASDVVQPYGARLSLGAINGPRSVVLSGETAALEEALAALAARGVTNRLLPVQYAFHSAQMAPFQQLLVDALGAVAASVPCIPFYSTVTGALASDECIDGSYFARNVREPVRFADAVDAMADHGYEVFLEIGPHPVLGGSLNECLERRERPAAVLTSLRRQKPERETMFRACAGLYEAGVDPAFTALPHTSGELVSLPAYPWQRKRFWIRQRPSETDALVDTLTGHVLLGRRVPAAGVHARIFEAGSQGTPAWLADHRIFGRVVMPAAAVLDAFAVAAMGALGGTQSELRDFAMHRPLFLSEAGAEATRWQVVVHVSGADRADLELFEAVSAANRDDVDWRQIASAHAVVTLAQPTASSEAVEGEAVVAPAFYERLAALGAAFGPAFRPLSDIRCGDGTAEGWLELPAALEPGAHLLHPVLLDGALQLCSVAARNIGELLLPFGADRVQIVATPATRLLARARVREIGSSGSLAADVTLETAGGERVARFEGMRFARAESGAFAIVEAASRSDDGVYQVAWQPAKQRATAPAARTDGVWLLLADAAGAAQALGREITAAGGRACLVRAGTAFAKTAPDAWTVAPLESEQLRRVIGDAGSRLRGVVHLWSLDVLPFASSGTDVSPDTEDLLATGALLHLVQGLVNAGTAVPVWVVTRGAQVASGAETGATLRPRAAGAWGLAGVVDVEHPEFAIRRVDLDPAETASSCAGLLAELLSPDEGSRSVALRGGVRWVPRLERYEARATPPAGTELQQVVLVRPGTLDGVELRPAPRAPLAPGEVRLRVLASGLNFRDVLLTLGLYVAEGIPLGAECVGTVIEVGAGVQLSVGARVLGFVPGSLATEVNVPAAFLAPVPATISTEDAASVPVAFLTAHYALRRLARLSRGERVLIHAAAGGVGLAAVQIALNSGAEVFATAGSPEKRALLRSMGVAHVMDSRSLEFADEILAATAGDGVHVVLNSLAGDFIASSLRIVRRGGVFLELGKRDVLTPAAAARQRPDVRYCTFDLGAEAQSDHDLLRPMFEELLAEFERGQLRPLPVTVYGLDEIREALRFMAQSKHIGKIVIRVSEPADADAPLVSGNASYWITGGCGGLGLETARWLVRSGARTVVLSGRRPPSPSTAKAIAELESQGATVCTFVADAGDFAAMRAIAEEIRRDLPPLRGVIHAAGLVDDAVLVHQTWERCRGVLRGKAQGAWVLHELTRTLPLNFFVLYSAAGTLLGAPGQGAYPAANAELDALAHARRRIGLPALSVAWGAWADIGMLGSRAVRARDAWMARGLGNITPALGFARLERLLRDNATAVAVMPIDWREFLAHLPSGVDRSFFSSVADKVAVDVAGRKTEVVTIVAPLRALPAGQRRHALVTHLTERARQVLGVDASTPVDTRVPLKELGLDSLMAVELRNTVARAIGQPLPATLLFDYPTVDAVADHLMRVLTLDTDDERGPMATEREPSRGEDVERSAVAGLSDDEAEALLVKEIETGLSRRTHVGSTYGR